jgi:hypothetical protein
MKVITLDDGKMYMVAGMENGGILQGAVLIKSISREEMCKYLKIVALNESLNIELSANSGYSTTELTDEQMKYFNYLKDIYAEATRKASVYTVNSVFDKLVAKNA